MSRDWNPFRLCADGERPPAPRPLKTREGVADRLRTAAFAELQAREAFLWAVERFAEAPEPLRRAWRELAASEHKHFGWLLERMRELGVDVAERPVSDALWRSLVGCENAGDFLEFMASAERRGQNAELRFQSEMADFDPESARVFGEIAREEAGHIALAARFSSALKAA